MMVCFLWLPCSLNKPLPWLKRPWVITCRYSSDGLHDLSAASHNSFGFPQHSFSLNALMRPFLTIFSTHFRNLIPPHKGNYFSRAILKEYFPPSENVGWNILEGHFPDNICQRVGAHPQHTCSLLTTTLLYLWSLLRNMKEGIKCGWSK